MWEPRRLTTLWTSTACYRDSFTYIRVLCCTSVSTRFSQTKRHRSYVKNSLFSFETTRTKQKKDASNISYIFACIRCPKNVCTELLPSNDKGIHIQAHRLMGGILEVLCWDGLRCHDIHTEFQAFKITYGRYTDSKVILQAYFYFFQIKESRLKRKKTDVLLGETTLGELLIVLLLPRIRVKASLAPRNFLRRRSITVTKTTVVTAHGL
jgi:hypothetical protein